MTTHEVVITYEDGAWHARGGGLDVAHADLRELDALVTSQLADRTPVDVRCLFDMTSLPLELHQYQAHYTNYTLRVPARESS